ncbi:MAG: membrane protein insertase YidC [Salibacteraceae bacterium]
MDRNTITGLLLIGLILIGYSLWMQPSDAELAEAQRIQDSMALAEVQEENGSVTAEEEESVKDTMSALPISATDSTEQFLRDSLERIQRKKKLGSFAAFGTGEAAYHTISNDYIKLTTSNKGAAPVSAELLTYVTFDTMPLFLFDKETSSFNFSFWANKSKELRSDELYFEPVADEMSDTKAVYRIYGDTRDQFIEVVYEVEPGESYMVDAYIQAVGMDNVLAASEDQFELTWDIQAPFHERSREQEQQKTTVYYKYMEDEADYVSETSYEEEELEATTNWVAFKQQFFSAALIAPQGFSKENGEVATIEIDDPRYTKRMTAQLTMEFDNERDPSFPLRFYIGPNHYQTLADLDIGLEDQIDLGWTIFGWVNRWLVIPVFNFLDNYTNLSYGIIILILTLLIKLMLSPLTWKNYISSARMKALKPEIDAINEKMKDKDAVAKQQATMTLYRQAGVNPMAGCIPMLLQLPILYAMFRFFPASIELRQESFLWAQDLSTYDSILSLPFEIPFYGSHVSLFTLLMAVSTFFYSKYNMDMAGAGGGGAQMPQMKMMIYFMPFMLLFFFNSYSSGLSYYYLTSNVVSMLQQFVIKRYFIDEDAIRAKIQTNKKNPKKKSNFQKRLEKMAKDRGLQNPK